MISSAGDRLSSDRVGSAMKAVRPRPSSASKDDVSSRAAVGSRVNAVTVASLEVEGQATRQVVDVGVLAQLKIGALLTTSLGRLSGLARPSVALLVGHNVPTSLHPRFLHLGKPSSEMLGRML